MYISLILFFMGLDINCSDLAVSLIYMTGECYIPNFIFPGVRY